MYSLYWAPDNASLVIRVLLEELGEDYATIPVNRAEKEHEGETYRKLNPNGLIPVLLIDGEPVFETAAIALTLADRHRQLAPPIDSPLRPQFLKWLFFLSNTVHSNLRQLFYPTKYVGTAKEALAPHAELTRSRLLQDFNVLEQAYQKLPGPYLAGESLSIVDIYAALCLRWPQLYPSSNPSAFEPAGYPALKRLLVTLQARPAVARAFKAEGIAAPYLLGAQYPDTSGGSRSPV